MIGWGISYKLKQFPRSKWVGPCGIYFMGSVPHDVKDNFVRMPFFFRTREAAREEIKQYGGKDNTCLFKVEKFTITYKKRSKK